MLAHVEALIISLKDNASRRANVQLMIKKIPLPAIIVDGVDGRSLDLEARHSVYITNKLHPHYPFSLSSTEIGTFLSHRKAWEIIVERNLDAGLVLEDDVEFEEPYFSRALAAAISASSEVQILKFGVRKAARPSRNKANIIQSHVPPLGNVAQLITLRAAIRLLELSREFDRPVDTFEQMIWFHRLPMATVEPSGVREISTRLGGTTIHLKAHPKLEELTRIIPRLRYRISVWFLSMCFSVDARLFQMIFFCDRSASGGSHLTGSDAQEFRD